MQTGPPPGPNPGGGGGGGLKGILDQLFGAGGGGAGGGGGIPSGPGGGMDPITAIANMISTTIDAFTWKGKKRWDLIPDYTDPADYQPGPDYTPIVIIGGMVFVFAIMALALRK